ncbi:hypothetical protein [Bacillus cereus]|uniref:Uncharacterized protein n=1 Tax=Bacillus cereus TaxID=1396 RepID=A0A164FSL0_BACCE|nr:hypothetical protein [Bacillus cereus]KZD36502.1 hypothetical protein B4082_2319 [Bacillus cereus]
MEKPTLKDYAKAAEIGVSKKNVDQRMRELHWSLERAITTPVSTSWEGNEKNKKLLRLAEKNGISESTFYRRKRNGMTPYDAATKPPRKYKRNKSARRQHERSRQVNRTVD